jgi:hypothetical protein
MYAFFLSLGLNPKHNQLEPKELFWSNSHLLNGINEKASIVFFPNKTRPLAVITVWLRV